ncbi:MAG TPA: outer membrane beta-barrel protein [Thiolinea sp.]|nr:outer membrane beta-barrel protein [Thiolinea sp.]
MKKFILVGLVLGLCTAAEVAQADGLFGFNTAPVNSNFSFSNGLKMYAGASAGYAMQGNACTVPFFKGSCDDSSVSWKVFGGARLNPMFGAEVAYAKLGTAEKSGSIGNQTVQVSNEIAGYQLSGVAYLPINPIPNLELMGKGGAMFWERNTKEALNAAGAQSTDKGVSPLLGMGAQYQINSNLHLRGEWEHVFNTGSGSDHETDADNYSVGFMYSTL